MQVSWLVMGNWEPLNEVQTAPFLHKFICYELRLLDLILRDVCLPHDFSLHAAGALVTQRNRTVKLNIVIRFSVELREFNLNDKNCFISLQI